VILGLIDDAVQAGLPRMSSRGESNGIAAPLSNGLRKAIDVRGHPPDHIRFERHRQLKLGLDLIVNGSVAFAKEAQVLEPLPAARDKTRIGKNQRPLSETIAVSHPTSQSQKRPPGLILTPEENLHGHAL